MEKTKRIGIYHMSVAKHYVIRMIKRDGAKDWLKNWTGTDDEAIAALQADPRETFCNCDNTDEKGHCKGHEKTET